MYGRNAVQAVKEQGVPHEMPLLGVFLNVDGTVVGEEHREVFDCQRLVHVDSSHRGSCCLWLQVKWKIDVISFEIYRLILEFGKGFKIIELIYVEEIREWITESWE